MENDESTSVSFDVLVTVYAFADFGNDFFNIYGSLLPQSPGSAAREEECGFGEAPKHKTGIFSS
jgi:hypothetical protein